MVAALTARRVAMRGRGVGSTRLPTSRPTVGGRPRRLAAAVEEWNSYRAPRIDSEGGEELLDELAAPMRPSEAVADLRHRRGAARAPSSRTLKRVSADSRAERVGGRGPWSVTDMVMVSPAL
jgi:hypothetical protein